MADLPTSVERLRPGTSAKGIQCWRTSIGNRPWTLFLPIAAASQDVGWTPSCGLCDLRLTAGGDGVSVAAAVDLCPAIRGRGSSWWSATTPSMRRRPLGDPTSLLGSEVPLMGFVFG